MANNPFTGKPAKRSTIEFKLHVAVVEHLNSCFPGVLFTHAANETRSSADAYWNKLKGVRKGTPDLLFWWRYCLEGTCYNLPRFGAIELKSPTGKPDGHQAAFEVMFRQRGGDHAYCRSVKEVHDTLVSWGCKAKYSWTKEPDIRSQQEKFSDAFEMYKP